MFGIANGALLLLGLWSGTALERRSSSSSSSRSVAALLLKYAPGSYARDIRLLAEHVSWDELSVTPSGSIDVRGLRVVAGDDALLSAKRVTCGLSWLQWLHVAANVTVEEPVVSVVAYDPLLRDTNWRRLGHELNRELSSSSSSSNASSWCGVTGVAFVGGATATVEPCEALGGKDARVTLRVDSLGTDPTSRRIAAAVRRKGSLTPAEVCAIVREDAAESLRAKLKAALPAKKDWWRSLRPSAAGVLSVGGVPVDSLDDAKTAVGRVAKGTLKFAVAAALRVVPFLNGAEDSIADLLQEYGADTLARARHRLSSSGRNDNNATPPPEPSSSSSSSSSEEPPSPEETPCSAASADETSSSSSSSR
eukprot:CAMPEP_0198652440 /NCGR_PEP_ID=MMETSP1467-20131203/6371_1 /TAXON_ID=1462469 /ORGANISM="unid. sp., Strain CCMP2135" /LENGTH=364 /DNA_ID=CAMNT_0044388357 /DNA_START=44 /DNA_END=1138 /DNA_ORIENTATION=-